MVPTFWVLTHNAIGVTLSGFVACGNNNDAAFRAELSVFSFSRWTYEEFFSRYRLLVRGPQNPGQAQALCRQALPELIPDQYCFGKT